MLLTRKMAQFWAICLLLMVIFSAEAQSPLEQWDDTFGAVGFGADSGILRDAVRVNGQLIVVGSFTEIGGIKTTNLAVWDGKNWSAFPGGFPGLGLLRQSLPYRSSFLVRTALPRIAGRFLFYWNGNQWEDIVTDVRSPYQGVGLDAMEVDGDGNLFVAGRCETINGVQAKCIAKWDGTNWTDLGSGLSVDLWKNGPNAYTYGGNIYQILSLRDKIYVAGGFTSAGGVKVPGLACWDGQKWSALGALDRTAQERDYPIFFSSRTSRPMVEHLGELYVIDTFRRSSKDLIRAVGRWDGVRWTLLPIREGTEYNSSGAPLNMASIMGDLYVTGAFFDPGFGPDPIPRYLLPVDAKTMARWDGQEWHRLGYVPLNGAGVMLIDGRDLIFSGGFTAIGDEDTRQPLKSANQLALWHVPPALRVQAKEFGTRLSWAIEAKDYALEVTDTLQPPDWQPFSSQGLQEDREMVVTVPPGSRKQFFRLVKHPVLK